MFSFNKYEATTKGLNFPTDIFDIQGFIQFFASLPNLLIYDGLPVFLPTKMIVQNPNIPEPNNINDLNWVPKFRSEASDWRNIPDDVYWKLPGKLIGNINIETWSGDTEVLSDAKVNPATFTMPAKAVTLEAVGTRTARTDTAYIVNHNQEQLDGSYKVFETENLTGTTDADATYTAKTYEGFTFDSTLTKPTGEIKELPNGSLVIDLYYTRNSYEVTLTKALEGRSEI